MNFFHTGHASYLNYDKAFAKTLVNTRLKDILSIRFALAILLSALPLHTILTEHEEKRYTRQRQRPGYEC